MNLAGLTDSLAAWRSDPAACPECGASVEVGHGLCLGCLLGIGTGEDHVTGDKFSASLSAVAVVDTHWRLGNYEVLEEIGRGGMGVIYRARQRHSRRIVALKRILSYHADLRETLTRFRRETEAAARTAGWKKPRDSTAPWRSGILTTALAFWPKSVMTPRSAACSRWPAASPLA